VPGPLELRVNPGRERAAVASAHPGAHLPAVASGSEARRGAPLVGGRNSLDVDDGVAAPEVRLQLVGEALDASLAEVGDLARCHVRPPSLRTFGRDPVEIGGFRPSGSSLTRAYRVGEGGLEPPRPCGHWHLKP